MYFELYTMDDAVVGIPVIAQSLVSHANLYCYWKNDEKGVELKY